MSERVDLEATKRQFPVHSSDADWWRKSIPWSFIAPHEEQAKHNHGGQSLEKLAERGGLSVDEIYAIVHNMEWQAPSKEGPRSRTDMAGWINRHIEAPTLEPQKCIQCGRALEHPYLCYECMTDQRLLVATTPDPRDAELSRLRGQVAAKDEAIRRVLERHQMLRTEMAPGPNTETCTCPSCVMLRAALSPTTAAALRGPGIIWTGVFLPKSEHPDRPVALFQYSGQALDWAHRNYPSELGLEHEIRQVIDPPIGTVAAEMLRAAVAFIKAMEDAGWHLANAEYTEYVTANEQIKASGMQLVAAVANYRKEQPDV